MSAKTRVAIVCGGRSAEHEISLKSAVNIEFAIDKNRYTVDIFAIDKQGAWFLLDKQSLQQSAQLGEISDNSHPIALIANGKQSYIWSIDQQIHLPKVDVLFPILHGPYGEDGAFQGLARMADMPCVGPSVLGSAIGMDKEVMKRLLRDANIDIAPFVTAYRNQEIDIEAVINKLGLPIYVKPANMGSSVGVSKVISQDELTPALEEAFKYDKKVLIESNVLGRELELAVLGNENPECSVAGEVITHSEFYSYESKYLDKNQSNTIIPAALSEEQMEKCKTVAIKTYQQCECQGLTRVDIFFDNNDQIIVNEINTLPGFTDISMYPKLWEASGMSQQQLMSKLIHCAIDAFKEKAIIKTSRQ